MDSEYYDDLKKAYDYHNKYATASSVIVTSPLFNMPYRYVDKQTILSFMSVYIKHYHKAYATLYQEKLSQTMVDEFNDALRVASYGGKDLIEAIQETLVLYKNYLDRLGIEVYDRQHSSEKEEVKEPSTIKLIFYGVLEVLGLLGG